MMSDLRIVLVGKNTSENNRVGNFILNKQVFGKKTPQPDVETFSERMERRNITVINTTHLLNPELKLQTLIKKVSEFSCPEAHVIILVLQHKDFSEKHREILPAVLNCFGEHAMKRTMILTSDDEKHTTKPKSVKENEFIQEISTECGGGHLQLQNTQRSQILQKVDEIITLSVFKDTKQASSLDEEDRRSEHSVRLKVRAADSEYKQFGKHSYWKHYVPNVISRSEKQKLILVLCGCETTLKTSMSKLLLGENAIISVQQESRSVRVWRDVELYGRLISLLELPALFNTRLSEEEVMRQTLCYVSLCHPGVHAFLHIINVDQLTNDDTAEIEKIRKIFDSREHFILLFTTDLPDDAPVTDFVKSNPECQRLISLCGGQYRLMRLNKPENSTQIPDLLDYIENMKTEPYSLQMYVKAQENRARHETEEKYEEKLKRMEDEIDGLKQKLQSEGVTHRDDDNGDNGVRIVLLGKTGVGKSATGNTILRREAFTSTITAGSVTRECKKEITEVKRRQITVIDTPGLFDTEVDNDEISKEIVKCVSMAAPGPHVFLLVIQVGRFTKEEKDAVKIIQETFGDKSRMYTMVLFTRGDDLKGTRIEDYSKGNSSLQNLIHQCGKRYHVFNNNEIKDQTQVSELLDKIDCMVKVNGGSFYTNEMFQQVEKNIKEEQERIIKQKEEEFKRKEEQLIDKYIAERKQLKEENERQRQKMQNELRKSEEEFKKKEEEIKKETDENLRKELQRKLEEKQKEFEEENKRKEKALEEQKQNLKYLEENLKKDKQNLQEKIQQETRQQAEQEYVVKLETEVAKALKDTEANVPYRSKRARDWSHYLPVVGGAAGGLVGTGEDFVYWIISKTKSN